MCPQCETCPQDELVSMVIDFCPIWGHLYSVLIASPTCLQCAYCLQTMTEASSHYCSMAQEWGHLLTVSLVPRISRGAVTHLLLVPSTSSVTAVATPLLPNMGVVMCP